MSAFDPLRTLTDGRILRSIGETESEMMSVGRAITAGLFWVNGSAMLGFALPIIVALVVSGMVDLDHLPGFVALIGIAVVFALSFLMSWIAWSFQCPRWRVWAYRKVDDIEALKSSAVTAGLLWPEGHFFQRTELRAKAQSAELISLENAGITRKLAAANNATPRQNPTPFGTAVKALVLGLICTPLCMLAPAGLLSWMGIDLTSNPIYWGLVAAFPLVLAAIIYRRARRDGVTADEGFKRSLPRGIRRDDGTD
jgi:hypothetical protein